MTILEAARTCPRGRLKKAGRTEFTTHRKGPNLQNSSAKSGLTNDLHRTGRNPWCSSARTTRSLRVAAIESNNPTKTTIQIGIQEPMGIGGFDLLEEGSLSPRSVNARKDNSTKGGLGRGWLRVPQTQRGTQLPSLGSSQRRLKKCPSIRPKLDDIVPTASLTGKLNQPSRRNRGQRGELVAGQSLSNLDKCLDPGGGLAGIRSSGGENH